MDSGISPLNLFLYKSLFFYLTIKKFINYFYIIIIFIILYYIILFYIILYYEFLFIYYL